MISIVVSMTRKRVIGKKNKIPWRVKSEQLLFKKMTVGNTLVMGRKTFESIGRVLPDRHNVIVSKSLRNVKGADVYPSLKLALADTDAKHRHALVIGGQSIYEQALPLADRLYVSYMKKDFEGDSFFPEIEKNKWKPTSSTDFGDFRHVVYERR